MNKKLLSFAMVFLLSLSFTVNTYAMDKRVKSSKSWTVTKEITKKEAKENKKYWRKDILKERLKDMLILKNIIMPMLYYLPIKLHMIKRVEELGEAEKLV